MYFSSDQGDSFSRALLPSASTEQVRHTEAPSGERKMVRTELEYVQKPEVRISDITAVPMGNVQELLLCPTSLVSSEPV